jgi:hypothetical protein
LLGPRLKEGNGHYNRENVSEETAGGATRYFPLQPTMSLQTSENGFNGKEHKRNLSLRIKVVAIYLIVGSILDLVWPLVFPSNPAFATVSFAYKIGSYSRHYLLTAFFIISGVGILLRKVWARKLGLILVPIGAYYWAGSVAWGLARGSGGGSPSLAYYGIGAGVSLIWNGALFWLLLDHRRKENYSTGTEVPFDKDSVPESEE